MIRAQNLCKTIDGVTALADLDFELARGEALALAGTSGAGRSTLLGILATLVRPTSGSVEIDGIDALREPHKVRSRIGYCGQTPALHPRLTAREHLELVAASRGVAGAERQRSIAAALEPTEVEPDRLIGTLSPGLRHQLDLAASLLGRSPVLLLDETFDRLDPLARRRFARVLARRRDEGTTMVVACNVFDPLLSLCDRIAVLHRGRLVAARTLGDEPLDPLELLTSVIGAQQAVAPPVAHNPPAKLEAVECSPLC